MPETETSESFDAESYYQDPAGFFAGLRESAPTGPRRMPTQERVWVLTRHADVRAALSDPRLAKDLHRWPGGARTWGSAASGVHRHMLHTDPPDHTRLRRLVQQAFTAGRVAHLRPRIEAITAGLLDAMAVGAGGDGVGGGGAVGGAGAGRVVDLLDVFARPLPITVLCELLGVPEKDRAWIGVIVLDYDSREEGPRVMRELADYLRDLIAAKRADPGDDFVSALVFARDEAVEDGAEDRLSEVELLSTVFQLIMAGFDTTVNLIASGTLALLTHPGELARLREDPSLLPAAVEELLRFTNPVNHASDRFTLEDTPVGDIVIPAGEWVMAATTAANRDPGRFPDPDRLDLGRDTSGHVAFGYGIHYCLGASLARMEAEIAFGALLERFPGLSLAVPPETLRWRINSLMNGLETLPVRLG